MKKYIIVFSIIALLLSPFIYLQVSKKFISVSPIEMVEVMQGDVEKSIVSEGELRVGNSKIIYLPESFFTEFQVNECKIKYMAPEGKTVDKGEDILQIEESLYSDYKAKIENEITQLTASMNGIAEDSTKQMKDVKLALENAKIDLDIKKIAVDQSIFDPQSTHERMKLEYRKSELAYENALMNYLNLRRSLNEKYAAYPARMQELLEIQKTKLPVLYNMLFLRSPFKGVISYKLNGNGLEKGIGSKLTIHDNAVLMIEDVSKLISRCYIEEDSYSKIFRGQKIQIKLKSNDLEIDTTISYVNKRIETVEGKKCFAIEAMIDNTSLNLIPNQTTINTIPLGVFKNVIYVPNSAIFLDKDKYYVITDDGLKKEVVCEEGNENFTLIHSGLTPGQLIYLNPSSIEH